MAGEGLVALLHLADRPVQDRLGLVRLDDHVLEQVGQAVVRGQLDALEVDQDHAHVVRGGTHQQAGDERVDLDALARAGRSGDQEVRHLGEVDGLRPPGHVAPEGERQLRAGGREVDRLEDAPQRDHVEVPVRDLDPNGGLARDGCLDPERSGGEAHREVVRQALDPADLDVRRRLDLVLVTTGPALRPTILASMSKLLSFLYDLLLCPAVAALLATERDGLRRVVEQVLARRGVAVGRQERRPRLPPRPAGKRGRGGRVQSVAARSVLEGRGGCAARGAKVADVRRRRR